MLDVDFTVRADGRIPIGFYPPEQRCMLLDKILERAVMDH
jgi:hypothetical protein